MDLIINKRKIIEPIESILKTVRYESKNQYLKDIIDKHDNVLCTCPFHKSGKELKPACNVVAVRDTANTYGTYYCFACKESGPITKLIGKCLSGSQSESDWESFGEEWLVNRYGNIYVEDVEFLPEITLKKSKLFLNESVLDNYEYDNKDALDYLINKRHLSRDVITYFRIGYNRSTNSVTFPCWDENGKLVGVFERNIFTKHFHIPTISPKPVYLLNEIKKFNYSTVYVCESQINALQLWSWSIPAVALFGTGSYEQYNILNKSGIRNYVLAFDGDDAGRKGKLKFIQNINKDCLKSSVIIPEGKDVNDFTWEEFSKLKVEWL